MKRLALVIGGAACVWTDTVAALRLATPDAVCVINDMIPLWPMPIDYAVTLHPDKLPTWLAAREARGLPAPLNIVAHRNSKHVTKIVGDWAGSSGLFSVKIAMEEKFAGVLLAGVTMDRTQHHFLRQRAWTSASAFLKGWRLHMAAIKPYTRSMSGWTQTEVGAPTADWLAQIGALPPDPAMIERVQGAFAPTS